MSTAAGHPSLGRRRSHASGLTLLEVLAAFLIFSMVFTVLVGTSQTAVKRQGLALRRLEAHLLAEDVLADLEAQMQQRERPILGDDYSRDIFEVTVRETPFGGAAAPGAGTDTLAGAGGSVEGLGVAGLLASELPEVAKHVLRYDIRVQWMESEGPQEIDRTTFAFDWPAAEVEFAALFGGTTGGQAGDGARGSGDEEGGAADEADGATPETGRRPRDRGAAPAPGSGELTPEQMRRMIEALQ